VNSSPKAGEIEMNSSKRRAFAALAAAAILTATVPLASLAQPAPAKHKVVFQVSDGEPQKWNLALNNVKNVQDDLGGDAIELEIVAYGPGIGMLKADSPVGKRVAEALKSGVKVVACENTMRGQKLGIADMLPNLGYVPAGVVELMARQRDGYAYIRP
jgi:intracellular sulfur oxidation DsrE/DsrF family protein